jgi:hypothetical protein
MTTSSKNSNLVIIGYLSKYMLICKENFLFLILLGPFGPTSAQKNQTPGHVLRKI